MVIYFLLLRFISTFKLVLWSETALVLLYTLLCKSERSARKWTEDRGTVYTVLK